MFRKHPSPFPLHLLAFFPSAFAVSFIYSHDKLQSCPTSSGQRIHLYSSIEKSHFEETIHPKEYHSIEKLGQMLLSMSTWRSHETVVSPGSADAFLFSHTALREGLDSVLRTVICQRVITFLGESYFFRQRAFLGLLPILFS